MKIEHQQIRNKHVFTFRKRIGRVDFFRLQIEKVSGGYEGLVYGGGGVVVRFNFTWQEGVELQYNYVVEEYEEQMTTLIRCFCFSVPSAAEKRKPSAAGE